MSENLNAAHEAVNKLHSDHCGCTECVQLYRAALLGLGLELRTVRAFLHSEREKSEHLERALKLHIDQLPGEGGIRLHSLAQTSDDEQFLYFIIFTPDAPEHRQLMLGIEVTNWMVLSLQVAEALTQAAAINDAQQTKPQDNRSN